ncbi:AB-hydrolase YheT [Cylindrobasidium torrendii FP15055 ss-10]|uniref:AB-hydrolase YheT n=1 Tax=Cylindrobasidium torrendii FP15055 ss-10 TaxID=1314674 RepID=A0A0D7B0W1_9AGAR|nr:AB-hydrolase YheT [Cylindrobasidium torrendii FP15055 ss-10]
MAKTDFFFPSAPASVELRNVENKSTSTKTLRAAIEERCPTLLKEFVPPWWMNGGHLQTLYCVVGDFTKFDKVDYKRTYVQLTDGGTVGLDFTPVEGGELADDTPIVVVLHGLTGGSHESYVRNILARACAPVEKGGLGYRAVVMNFRGCAGTPITGRQLYSAGWTNDIRQSLMFIQHKYPDAPLHGIGFSLGANVLVRYLAEEGDHSRLSSGVALACPWDLAANNNALNNSFLGRHVYSKGMANNLLRVLRRHTEALVADPTHEIAHAMHAAFRLKNPTLEDFDEAFTCKGGGGPPVFPLKDSAEYYKWASSHHVLPDVRTPLLTLNAADDPVVQQVPVGVDNPHVVMGVTKGGGHLGWFEAAQDRWFTPVRWISKPALEWLRMVGTDMVAPARGKPLFVGEDGWIRQEGDESLGVKEIEEGQLVHGAERDEELIQGL